MSRRTAQEELTRTGPQKGGSTGSVDRVVRDGVLIFHSIHRVMRAEKMEQSQILLSPALLPRTNMMILMPILAPA